MYRWCPLDAAVTRRLRRRGLLVSRCAPLSQALSVRLGDKSGDKQLVLSSQRVTSLEGTAVGKGRPARRPNDEVRADLREPWLTARVRSLGWWGQDKPACADACVWTYVI